MLSIEDQKLLIDTFRSDLCKFAKMFFPHLMEYETADFQEVMYNDYSTTERLAQAAPRGFTKSTLGCVIYPVWASLLMVRRDICIISASETLAVEFLRKIRLELTANRLILDLFGDVQSEKWTENHIVLKNGVNIRAKGAGGQIRGFRPDCHVKGTLVLDGDKYIPIENSSYFKTSCMSETIKVRVHGIPLHEKVTPNHRYWAMKKYKKNDKWFFEQPKWTHANELTLNHYIGKPIDVESDGLHQIDVYKPGVIKERDSKGRIISSGGNFVKEIPEYMSDKDFWWVIGLWWGDGHLSKNIVGWTVSNGKTHKRLCKFLKRIGGYSIVRKTGCWQVIHPNASLSRWLKSWKFGNAIKNPPLWVRHIDNNSLSGIVNGYIEADGYIDDSNQARVTSVNLQGLFILADMLARLGIASSIRNGIDGGTLVINGIKCNTRKKYDLMFRDGGSKIGLPIIDSTRYVIKRFFIKDQFLWRKLRSIEDGGEQEIIPIQTKNHTYITPFGLSHNCIILDDIETDESVESEEQRKKLKEWLLKACLNTLLPGGQLILQGTLIHPLSVLTDFVDVPRSGWVRRKYRAYIDGIEEKGHELWPNARPHEWLQARKAEIGSWAFAAEFMNDPRLDDNVPIKESYLRYWEVLPKQYSSVIAIDPAYSEDEKSDFKVAVNIICDQHMNRYLAEYIRTHEPSGSFIDAVLNMWQRNRSSCVALGCPNGGTEKEFFRALLNRANERKIYPPIVELKNTFVNNDTGVSVRNKKRRIVAALQPLFEQGKYYIHADHIEARDELLTIGSSRWDDLVDAMTYAESIVQPYYGQTSENGGDGFPEAQRGDDYGYGNVGRGIEVYG